MPFDLTTAQPVESAPKPKFDLSTAKPVDSAAAPTQPAKSTARRLADSYVDAVGSAAEPLAQLATSAVATPIAGIAGIGASLIPGVNAADVVGKVQGALTYEPKTESGKETSAIVGAPFEWLTEKADDAGEFARQHTGSNVLATGVNAAVQMLPALVLKGVGKGANAFKSMPHEELATTAAAKAAVKNAGLDWDKLPGQVQAKIKAIAQDSSKLQKLSPEALEREARMQSHPVPMQPTLGQAERNPSQLKIEKQASQTDSGAPIRARYVEQNQQFGQNLDVLRDRTGARVAEGNTESQGGVVQLAERAKLAAMQDNVRNLYRKAEDAGELDQSVSVQPIIDHINDQLKFGPQGLEFAKSWLKSAGVAADVGPDGLVLNDASKTAGHVSLNELEQLRQRASTIARTDQSTAGHDAGNLVRVIDSVTDNTEAGPLYKAARAARKAQGAEFERQGAVGNLVKQKGGTTDNKVALEDTWKKSVLGGSIQDLRNVVQSVNNIAKNQNVTAAPGMVVDARSIGRRAVKELAGQTIDYLKAEATKGVGTMEDGTPKFGAAGFVKAVDRIGRPKLEILLGKTATDELYKLSKSAKDLLTDPPSLEAGSSTFSNILNWMDKNASKLYGVGPVVSGVAKYGAKAYQLGKASAETAKALKSPLQAGADTSARDISGAVGKAAEQSVRPLVGAQASQISSGAIPYGSNNQ